MSVTLLSSDVSSPILVEEPTVEQTLEILKGVRQRYEEHHKLKISDEALKSAANLAARYIPDRFLPDKAIDLIDEAASRVRIQKREHAHHPERSQTAGGEHPQGKRDCPGGAAV